MYLNNYRLKELFPALLIHPETIAENIAEMIKVATEVTQKMKLKYLLK